MKLTSSILLAAGLLGATGASFAADPAASYPNQPIRLVLANSPGAGSDILGRFLASKLSPLLKTPIVVENKPGAAGVIGTQFVARAKPDGYTLTMGGASTHLLSTARHSKLGYDPVKDFSAIGQIGTAPILLVANKDFTPNNLKELSAYQAKQNEPLQYASWGEGSTGHFCGALLKQLSGIPLEHIPYKGIGDVLNGVVGNQVKIGFVDVTSGTQFVKDGRLKALATCASPTPSLPDTQTYAQQGVKFDGKFRWALYAPANTPKEIIGKLSQALDQVLDMPDVKERLLSFGITPEPMQGEALEKIMAQDIATWIDVAEKANLRVE